MTNIKIIGGYTKGGLCGVSVPANADVNVTIENHQMENTGTGVEVRDPVIERAIADLVGKLPPGIGYHQVAEVIKAVQHAPADAGSREEAIKKSPVWSAFKDVAPEVTAFIIKTALELAK